MTTMENILMIVSIFATVGCVFGVISKGKDSVYAVILKILFFPLYMIYLVYAFKRERKRARRARRRPLNPWWL